jgi:hypothetical protein
MNNYFSHDSNARNSDKIINLRMKFGVEGYGIYFMLLERLREEPEYMSIKDYNMIAFDFRVSTEKVKSVIEDFGLFVFTEDGKYFYSESFKKRMVLKDEKSKKRSEAGIKGMSSRWKNAKSITKLSETDNNVITKPLETITRKEKESKVDKNNITPTPPKGGGKKKNSAPKSINQNARAIFEEHFKSTFSDTYYWTAKDAGAMSQLLKKLTFSREQKNLPVDDDSVLYALKYFLSQIKEGWIFENFSVTNINSKFNEIVSQAKKVHSGKPDVGIVLKDNSVDKYSNDDEKWKR